MKKITVTIGIPAFNEEQTIKRLLPSLFRQQYKQATIKQILVYSDASTDLTNQVVNLFRKKSKKVKLIVGKVRKGKYYRMNELLRLCKTEVLIIMDADIRIVGEKFIETFVQVLIKDKKALLVSARNRFVTPKGFMPRIIHAYYVMWDIILPSLPNIEYVGQFSGTVTAFRGSYARTLRIPQRVTNPHFYLYLAAKRKEGFRYSKKVEVLQIVPTTITEVKTILTRQILKQDPVLVDIFGPDMIRKAQAVKRSQKIQTMLKSFIQNPFFTPGALFLTIYIKYLSKKSITSKSALWDIASSTKKPISYV